MIPATDYSFLLNVGSQGFDPGSRHAQKRILVASCASPFLHCPINSILWGMMCLSCRVSFIAWYGTLIVICIHTCAEEEVWPGGTQPILIPES